MCTFLGYGGFGATFRLQATLLPCASTIKLTLDLRRLAQFAMLPGTNLLVWLDEGGGKVMAVKQRFILRFELFSALLTLFPPF